MYCTSVFLVHCLGACENSSFHQGSVVKGERSASDWHNHDRVISRRLGELHRPDRRVMDFQNTDGLSEATSYNGMLYYCTRIFLVYLCYCEI